MRDSLAQELHLVGWLPGRKVQPPVHRLCSNRALHWAALRWAPCATAGSRCLELSARVGAMLSSHAQGHALGEGVSNVSQ